MKLHIWAGLSRPQNKCPSLLIHNCQPSFLVEASKLTVRSAPCTIFRAQQTLTDSSVVQRRVHTARKGSPSMGGRRHHGSKECCDVCLQSDQLELKMKWFYINSYSRNIKQGPAIKLKTQPPLNPVFYPSWIQKKANMSTPTNNWRLSINTLLRYSVRFLLF